jgi:methyl-accepting chemotaxis protein
MSASARLLSFGHWRQRLPSIRGLLGRMNIGTRLALAFAVLLALAASLGGFAMLQLGAVQQASTQISEKWMAGVRLTSQMNTDASNFRIAEAQHVLSADDEERARYVQELRAVADALKKNEDEYAKLIASDDEKQLFDEFRRERQRYLDEHQKVIRLSAADETEDAKMLLRYNSQKKYDGAAVALRRLVDFNIAQGQQASRQSDATYRAARRWIVALVLGAVALGAALAYLITRSITRPLRAAVGVADAVSRGDLSVQVEVRGTDETARLLTALQTMTRSLSSLVGEVHQGSEQVAASSQQIAVGNADLSQRTEQQAARLQQVASSMVQLDTAVRAIDESAGHAAKLALGASELAGQGSQVMGRVVETMQQIAASSSTIGEITSVIDNIAFRTNILALNAAVEAARAGEMGRGFGVVAGEVRALAHSSAQAAREIKALIDQSKERVSAGSVLVGEAGGAIDEIVGQVQGVNELITKISTATSAQATGISSVCKAVEQLDRSTQQNAALVEQSAAASESLKEQAGHLLDAVSVFRTTQG